MKKHSKVILLVLVFISIVLIGVGVYFLTKNNNLSPTKTNLVTVVNKMKSLDNYQARLFIGKDTGENTDFPMQDGQNFSMEYTIDQINKKIMYRPINHTNPQAYTYFDYDSKMLYIEYKEEYKTFPIDATIELFELYNLIGQYDQVLNASDSFSFTIKSDQLKNIVTAVTNSLGAQIISRGLGEITSDLTLTFKIDKEERFTDLELTYLIENDEKVIIKADFSNLNETMKIELPSIAS